MQAAESNTSSPQSLFGFCLHPIDIFFFLFLCSIFTSFCLVLTWNIYTFLNSIKNSTKKIFFIYFFSNPLNIESWRWSSPTYPDIDSSLWKKSSHRVNSSIMLRVQTMRWNDSRLLVLWFCLESFRNRGRYDYSLYRMSHFKNSFQPKYERQIPFSLYVFGPHRIISLWNNSNKT